MVQSLFEKLRIKPGNRIAVLNAPETHASHPALLSREVAVFDSLQGTFDQVHLFVTNSAVLEKLAPPAIEALNPDGLLWVYFPKKTSNAQSDLSRDRGWETMRKAGLSGISLISLDEMWSAFAFRRRSGKAMKLARHSRRQGVIDKKVIDRTRRIVRPPEDLQRALRRNKTIAVAFDALSWSHKKEYVQWILEAKKDETRARRIEGTIERLHKGLKNPWDKGRR